MSEADGGRRRRPLDNPEDENEPDMGDLFDDLTELEGIVDSEEERERVRETMRTASGVSDGEPPVFGRIIWGFDRADLSEAVLGALLFGIPMAVEGGTNEAGAYVATNPIYLGLTLLSAVVIVYGVLYVAEIQDVRVAYAIFGLIPTRLAGVLLSSFATGVVLLTIWGRVEWSDPWLAFCTCSVAFVPMAIGAALGDILPGS
jgi:uncharacterized membrane protein